MDMEKALIRYVAMDCGSISAEKARCGGRGVAAVRDCD
jgi:hypothetical protein